MTAFIIVMEMVAGNAMVLNLMACALPASGIARLGSARTLSCLLMDRCPFDFAHSSM
jgi:hypothetical protein